MQWVKADAAPEQMNLDAAQCQQEAWREAQWRSFFYRPFGPTWLRERRGRPLSAWPMGDPFGDSFMEEARLASFCMRAKGYELQPVEQK